MLWRQLSVATDAVDEKNVSFVSDGSVLNLLDGHGRVSHFN